MVTNGTGHDRCPSLLAGPRERPTPPHGSENRDCFDARNFKSPVKKISTGSSEPFVRPVNHGLLGFEGAASPTPMQLTFRDRRSGP